MGSARGQTLSEINTVITKMERSVSVFAKRDRKGLLIKAAAPVRKQLRADTKVRDKGSTKVRPWDRVNVVGGREYKPRNLRRSMKRLTKLKRSGAVFVGPDFGKRAKPNADGYYYAMAYGTAEMYRKRLLIPAQRKSERASIQAFRKDFARRFGTRAAQQKLDVG